MSFAQYAKNIFIVTMLISILVTSKAVTREISELSIIKSFFADTQIIETIKTILDKIENNKLGYDDYAKRTGLIWSDVLVTTSNPAEILKEYKTEKVTLVGDALTEINPQSLLNYDKLAAIVSEEILPTMFKTIGEWVELPEHVYAQVFFQRCSNSDAMEWHQDPGEDYDPQAHYSLVLMLSEQDDPQNGWSGGVFSVRPGLPEDTYDEHDVMTIIPKYNQGILFNNQRNSHCVTEVLSATDTTQRDIIVITINLTTLPTKKD